MLDAGHAADDRAALLDELRTLRELVGEDAISVYRRMQAAAAGARAERDIMRAAVETIAAGAEDPVTVAQQALHADRARREANLAALQRGEWPA